VITSVTLLNAFTSVIGGDILDSARLGQNVDLHFLNGSADFRGIYDWSAILFDFAAIVCGSMTSISIGCLLSVMILLFLFVSLPS